MRLENLRVNYPSLISRLEANGYSANFIARVRKMVETILSESCTMGWNDYYDVLRHYESGCRSRDDIIKKRTVIGAIMEFDLNGKFPDRKPSMLVKRGAYYKLFPEFRMLIDHFKSSEQKRGKKESSIVVESSNASSFFLKMQEAGAVRLGDITEEMMVAVFLSSEGGRRMNTSQRKYIINAIRSNIPLNPHDCRKVLDIMPKTKKVAKNIQYLNDKEKNAILLALDDMSNHLTLRDRAIGKLAYFTGVRSSDITAMDLSSIDWRRDVILLKQQKTSAALEIPLRAPVGNTIYDYLAKERPLTECPALFISKNKPYRRLTSLWHTSAEIHSAAGIRQAGGDRKGLHIFRHRIATDLMDIGVPQAVIADVLGHAAPDSLEPYLSADIARLRECALSIARFTVDGEVFCNA